MVAPLDPLRGPASAPQTGPARPATGPSDGFELEFQRLLQNAASAASGGDDSAPTTPAPSVLDGDALAASLDGVSESLKRATAYVNAARAYFKNSPPPPAPGANS